MHSILNSSFPSIWIGMPIQMSNIFIAVTWTQGRCPHESQLLIYMWIRQFFMNMDFIITELQDMKDKDLRC